MKTFYKVTANILYKTLKDLRLIISIIGFSIVIGYGLGIGIRIAFRDMSFDQNIHNTMYCPSTNTVPGVNE